MISFFYYSPQATQPSVNFNISESWDHSLIFHVVPVTSSKLEKKLQSTSLCYIIEIQIWREVSRRLSEDSYIEIDPKIFEVISKTLKNFRHWPTSVLPTIISESYPTYTASKKIPERLDTTRRGKYGDLKTSQRFWLIWYFKVAIGLTML